MSGQPGPGPVTTEGVHKEEESLQQSAVTFSPNGATSAGTGIAQLVDTEKEVRRSYDGTFPHNIDAYNVLSHVCMRRIYTYRHAPFSPTYVRRPSRPLRPLICSVCVFILCPWHSLRSYTHAG